MRVRRKWISHLVHRLLGEHGVDAPPIPVEAIAMRHGLKIHAQPLQSDLSGFLYRDGTNVVIGVNTSQPEVRQRFTIAHELGHFFLHHDDALHVDRAVQAKLRSTLSSAGTDPEEIEANWFAAELLMPSGLIAQDMAHFGGTDILDEEQILRLARRYRVSAQALLLRVTNLGYVDQ